MESAFDRICLDPVKISILELLKIHSFELHNMNISGWARHKCLEHSRYQLSQGMGMFYLLVYLLAIDD